MKIEVKTYEESRLEFFKDLARKAEKKLDRCIKAMKKSDYNNPLSEAQLALDDACEKKSFYCDVVDMLCLERKETNKEAQIEAPLEIQRIDFKVNDKQIEEMAKDMCEYYYEGTCYQDKKPCDCKCEIFTDAQYLYAKGYRKASSVAEEIFEEIDKLIIRRMRADISLIDDRLVTDIAEFKKKYTEGEG